MDAIFDVRVCDCAALLVCLKIKLLFAALCGVCFSEVNGKI